MEKKGFVSVFILLFSLVLMSGCASTHKKEILTISEMTATTLEEAHLTAEKLCDEGRISGKVCNDMRALYSNARDSFRLAQDALVLYAKAEDSIAKKNYEDLYLKQMNEVENLLKNLQDLIMKWRAK